MLAPVPPAPSEVTTWEQALEHIRARSTELRIALAEVSRAEAQNRAALAAVLPTLNLNASATHQFITNPVPGSEGSLGQAITGNQGRVPTPDTATAGFTLGVPLLALAPWYNVGTSKKGIEVAQWSLEDQKRTISLNVAGALVGAITAERVAELNRNGLRSALERMAITLRRRELGGASGIDVVRAQQDVESARATLVTGDESLRQARESLGLALGISAPMGVSRELNLNGLEASARTVCQDAPSLEERADLMAAKKRVEVAERNVQSVKLQFAPQITAQSALTGTPINQGIAPEVLWNIQAVLSWSIFDGGTRYANTRSNRAVLEQSQQSLEALRRTGNIQVVQARRAVQVAEQSRKVAADARALAAEVERLTRTGYQEGRGTSLELVVAAASLRQADITLALREFELVRARILAILALARCPW
jgi:outer membrane protein TolC